MAARGKSKPRPTKSLGRRLKENPISTSVGELKKLGVPRWASKAMILLTTVGAVSPTLSAEANRIPLASTFTGLGARLRARIMGYVR